MATGELKSVEIRVAPGVRGGREPAIVSSGAIKDRKIGIETEGQETRVWRLNFEQKPAEIAKTAINLVGRIKKGEVQKAIREEVEELEEERGETAVAKAVANLKRTTMGNDYQIGQQIEKTSDPREISRLLKRGEYQDIEEVEIKEYVKLQEDILGGGKEITGLTVRSEVAQLTQEWEKTDFEKIGNIASLLDQRKGNIASLNDEERQKTDNEIDLVLEAGQAPVLLQTLIMLEKGMQDLSTDPNVALETVLELSEYKELLAKEKKGETLNPQETKRLNIGRRKVEEIFDAAGQVFSWGEGYNENLIKTFIFGSSVEELEKQGFSSAEIELMKANSTILEELTGGRIQKLEEEQGTVSRTGRQTSYRSSGVTRRSEAIKPVRRGSPPGELEPQGRTTLAGGEAGRENLAENLRLKLEKGEDGFILVLAAAKKRKGDKLTPELAQQLLSAWRKEQS